MTHKDTTTGDTSNRRPGATPSPAVSAARLLGLLISPAGRSVPGMTADSTPSSRLTRALAFKATVAAAAGLGVLAGGGSAAWAGLQHQAKLAAKRIGLPEVPPPLRDGFYLPDGSFHRRLRGPVAHESGLLSATPIALTMLGDSTMAGYGAATEDDLPGVMLARAIAASIDRPVHLRTRAVVGSGAAGLALQVQETLLDRPDVAVISVGANDVRDRVAASISVGELTAAVRELTSAGISVVVGTCPDLGVIAPIPQPLRQLAGYWSRTLATKQELAMAQLGVACIPLGRVVSPEFLHHPDLFSPDMFHPSGAGYARAVAALLPAVVDVIADRDRPDPARTGGSSVAVEADRQPYLSVVADPDSPSGSAMLATS